ncbi:MAG: RecX family transcriptional regulator [Pseudomonadota bacterium]
MVRSSRNKTWPPKQEQLLAYARRHCARYPANRATLCRVLQKYSTKYQSDSCDRVDSDDHLIPVLDQLEQEGVLDGYKFAKSHFQRLMERGVSLNHLKPRLLAKSVPEDLADRLIKDALAEMDRETLQLQACARYALRCGLGAARLFSAPPGQTQRDIAKMARNGFSYSTVRQILEIDDMGKLQELANYDGV